MINIRDLSIRCGRCGEYQTLCDFEAGDGFNRYTYECDDSPCVAEETRTELEVPVVLDLFKKKPPMCGGDPED